MLCVLNQLYLHQPWLLVWYAAVSLSALFVCWLDKYRAKASARQQELVIRISMSSFYLLAAAGGALGLLIGCYLLRHKISGEYLLFRLYLVLCLLLHAAVIYAAFSNYPFLLI
ncbi:MAG: DUF1294 domain-containing protein [Succinivibrio sp.]|nr:DUF1294 domain-containing protein [Succinivibrio sp.]